MRSKAWTSSLLLMISTGSSISWNATHTYTGYVQWEKCSLLSGDIRHMRRMLWQGSVDPILLQSTQQQCLLRNQLNSRGRLTLDNRQFYFSFPLSISEWHVTQLWPVTLPVDLLRALGEILHSFQENSGGQVLSPSPHPSLDMNEEMWHISSNHWLSYKQLEKSQLEDKANTLKRARSLIYQSKICPPSVVPFVLFV